MPNDPRIADQYRTATTAGGLYFRDDRGLIEVTGPDRATWLNNLVTNAIKTLPAGEGNYAFAVNVKGRTVFDLNMLALEDRLWLDIDRRWLAPALGHLNRYIVTENVGLADVSPGFARAAVLGLRASELVIRLGFGHLAPMASLQHVAGRISATEARMVRHDFAGLPGAEFIYAAHETPAARRVLETPARELGFAKLDRETVEILRIEAGIPASVDDIDEDVVPPETGQIERGISYTKGCYLGQEVIERMRSHGVLARKLVGVRFEGEAVVPPRSPVSVEGADVGRTMSCCWSEALGAVLALAYVKTSHARPQTPLDVQGPSGLRRGEVVAMPVRT